MSVISNIHTATVYEPKTSKAFAGQRLVKIVAKADKSGNYGEHLQQTMCVSIPLLDAQAIRAYILESSALDAHIVGMLEDVQKSLITDKIKSGNKSVTSDELTINALINYLDSSADSDKWDTARIAQWFSDNIAEGLGIMLVEKGAPDEKLEMFLNAAQKLFSDSLGSKAKIPAAYMEKINQMLTHASDKESAIYKRFYNRVNPEKSAEIDLESALGF